MFSRHPRSLHARSREPQSIVDTDRADEPARRSYLFWLALDLAFLAFQRSLLGISLARPSSEAANRASFGGGSVYAAEAWAEIPSIRMVRPLRHDTRLEQHSFDSEQTYPTITSFGRVERRFRGRGSEEGARLDGAGVGAGAGRERAAKR
jgi:hypothetical protein